MTEPNSFNSSTNNPGYQPKQAGQSNFVPGQVVGERYKIESTLGVGGMGVVYKVEQIFLRKIFAMKTLEIEDATGMFSRRFQQEGAAVSRLDHPNVIRIHDFGLLDGKMPFYVMDYINGTSLSGLLKKQGSLEVADALKIFIRVSMALQHAHESDIVHRDIKPSNIMLRSLNFDSETCVKLVDFGIAKLKTEGNELQNLTRTGDIFGSPLYMSPEQCLGIGVDHRTDIYSFGCALFEALTGSPPHVGENSLSTMIKHREEQAPSLSDGSLGKKFPAELEAVVAQLLQKNPDERYQNFADVTEDLIAVSAGKKPTHVQLKKTGKSQAKSKSSLEEQNRSPLRIATIAAVVGAILCILGAGAYFAQKALKPDSKKPTVATEVKTERANAPVATVNELAQQTQNEADSEDPAIPPEIQEFYDTNQLKKRDKASRRYEKEPYSTECINSRHEKVRVFQFPTDVSLGKIEIGHAHIPARGDVLITDPAPIKLTAGYDCCDHPSLLDKFRPNEVGDFSCDSNESANDEVLSHISKWTKLFAVDISKTDIGDRGLSYLNDISTLKELHTTDTPVTGKGIASLKHLNTIVKIDDTMLNDAGSLLKALRGSQTLETLNVRCSRLTNDDLKNLSGIKTLRYLDISENKQLTDKGIQYLTDLPLLRSLGIRQCQVTEASFPVLQKFPHLKAVWIVDDWPKEREELFHKMFPKVELNTDLKMQHLLKSI